jgi:hypothetical protein
VPRFGRLDRDELALRMLSDDDGGRTALYFW